LPWDPLPHAGAMVDLQNTTAWSLGEAEAFREALAASLREWRELRLKSAWLRVPLRLAPLMSVASELRFAVHHGHGECVVLKRWLRPELEDKVPPFATHQVGVAGFVLTPDNELLVMKEQGARKRNWKMAGGLLDPGETFGEAACREVLEETGVQCRFRSVLAFWHRHGLQWGQSDLYVVCRLEPESRTLNIDPEEVSDCRWIPVEEFLRTEDHPLILHVLRVAYGLDFADFRNDASRKAPVPLLPLAEIEESAVQWPNREPYPTYHGAAVPGTDR